MAQAHTARFLQTFHTGRTQAQRNAASETDTPTDRMDTDPAALAFVKAGRPVTGYRPAGETPVAARNDGSYLVEIKGHQVRCGGGNVSEAQAKRIIDIATTRVVPEGRTAESVLVRLEQGMAKFAGSQFITAYKDLPRKGAEVTVTVEPFEAKQDYVGQPSFTHQERHQDAAKQTLAAAEVEAGRYALHTEDGVKFYRVTKGKGRWAGRTFVEAQASDDHYPIRNAQARQEILDAIAVNPLEAEQLYGRELGKCSRCGRTLTDETSRAYGIGPDCRNK